MQPLPQQLPVLSPSSQNSIYDDDDYAFKGWKVSTKLKRCVAVHHQWIVSTFASPAICFPPK